MRCLTSSGGIVYKSSAEAKAAASGKAATYLGLKEISDYVQAHRTFIKKFVDTNINIKEHMCDITSAKDARSIIDITLALRK